ncbi:BglG family transcription antiterminator [Metabacillus rhizolycopersici]|uniref:BglG family transcription antiterminator n=1 Tax=Metabacillus rhizolycopersici TaxID=2875709 RepID=A0ABS7UZ03_9BACI|nr:BglG family transcription antiterminator [Metabacillus rhizolycopersici]MBZ5753562.1 BglG family transcription antiterminator [Metabacillus rhizolycopersici]
MNARMISILTILLEMRDAITSNELAKQLGISSRTVKRYIQDIHDFAEKKHFKIITSHEGYKLVISEEERFYLVEELRGGMTEGNQNAEDLETTVLLYLLSVDSATIEDISEHLFCSRNTAFNKLKAVKQELEKYQLQLCNKGHQGYRVLGNELMIRSCFTAHFSRDNYYMKSIMKQLFNQQIDFEWLLSMFTKQLKQFSLRKSTEEVQLFLKYLLVSALRQNKINKPINLEEESLNVTHLRVTSQTINEFEKQYEFVFSQEEHLFLAMVLGGGSIVPSEKAVIEQCIEAVIKKIQEEFNEHFIKEDHLKESLGNHIASTLKRLRLQITIENPLKELIQSRYFMATYYAYMLAEELNLAFNISLDDHEIAYLALHFEANMESKGMLNKVNVLVVCGGGIGTSTVLKSKLESNFPQLHIQDVLPYYLLKKQDLTNIDFIISTLYFENETDKKVIHVNPILNESDSERILQMIRFGTSVEYVQDLFQKDLFFTECEFQTRQECLVFLTNRLISKGLIHPNVQQEVLQREEISTTELGNLTAIPHCITDQQSRMAMLILKKPIQWKNEKVQLIFFGCINPKEKQSKKYFPQIYKKVSQITWVKEALHQKQFDSFVNLLNM